MDHKPSYGDLEQRILKLESALEESIREQRLIEQNRDQIQFISDHSPGYMAYVGADDLIYKFVNHPFEVAFNRPRDQIVGQHIKTIIGESNYEFSLKYIDIVRSGKATSYENIFHLAQGKRWIKVNYTPDFNQQGNVVGIVVLSYDVSEQKEAEERLNLVIKGSNDAPWDWNLITNEPYYSPQWWHQLGYAPNELTADASLWIRLMHPGDADHANDVFQSALKSSADSYDMEYRLLHKEGHYVPILARGFITRDKDGQPVRVTGTNMDLSERKRVEAEKTKLESLLLQSRKMEAIGTLAGGIAHDFNNMLSVITGNISLALSSINNDDPLFEVLSDVKTGARQAQKLTHQLLTFAKGGEPIKKPSNINHLLEESATFVTRGTKSRCEFSLSPDLWSAEVDPGQINQVISNIVINADQAMPQGGIITLRTENTDIDTTNGFSLPAGRYIKITISDRGLGIHDDHLPDIFNPYFTTKQKGSGLGLATSYSIIKKHGGHIAVESKLGYGTTFHIYLQASDKNVVPRNKENQSDHSGHGRILIMDDQETILIMLSRMLNIMGYETACACDGAQAIALFQEAYHSGMPFDLAILDLTVPGGLGGAETLLELIKIDPHVKALVSSGYSNDPVMARYHDYGFSGVIPKPYTRVQLAEILIKIFGKK